jgi:septal ring factor EnvC (AmiA/AmiB activator)
MIGFIKKLIEKPSLFLWLLVPFFIAFLIVVLLKSNLFSSIEQNNNQTQQQSNSIDTQIATIEGQAQILHQQTIQNDQDIEKIEQKIKEINENGVSENWYKNQ